MKTLKPLILVFLASWCFGVFFAKGQSYVITDVAGVHKNGFSGDGGPATMAHLNNPIGILVDNAGNIFIADWGNSKIRMVNQQGTITTFAGNEVFGYSGDGGQANASELKGPMGIVSDLAGNIYVTDIGNERIRKIDKNGVITTFAGTGKYGHAGDGGPALNATFEDPIGICRDSLNNFYIADAFNNRVRKINSAGIITTIAGNGGRGYSGDGGQATAAQLYYPIGVTTDLGGNLYIVDEDNNCIRKVTTSGIIYTVAGNGTNGYSGDSGPATNAELASPASVAVDSAGNMFIADRNNDRIRQVDTNGIIETIAGNGKAGYSGSGGPATAAELYNPSSITLDKKGNIYFTNPFNDRVQKLTEVISENVQTQVSVYPNPGTGLFTFNLVNAYGSQITLDVFDILGQKVLSTGLNAGANQVNLQAKGRAIYIFRVYQYHNSTISTGKLIVM